MKLALLLLPFILCNLVFSQSNLTMNKHASGEFEIKLTPQPATDAGFGHLVFDKQFQGALEATSKGEMWTSGEASKGAAGYVALERVTGKLDGRAGSFVLQHSGSMSAGKLQLAVTFVPGSGSGELTGIDGAMTIRIEGGKHFYQLDYTLAEPQTSADQTSKH